MVEQFRHVRYLWDSMGYWEYTFRLYLCPQNHPCLPLLDRYSPINLIYYFKFINKAHVDQSYFGKGLDIHPCPERVY